LRDLPEPPAVVYVTGELPRTPAVAVVGTRHPTPEGVAFARRLAAELVGEGVAVLSGGAVGIDTAAHEGAMDGGGPTVVVAPSSVERPYPAENKGLFDRVLAGGGAHITTHPAGTGALRHHFFERNAILAALANALVIVESRYRGGARNAVSAARRLSRPVLAVPGAPWVSTSAGCLLEIKAGARVVASVRDVLDAIAVRPLPLQPELPLLARASVEAPAGDRRSEPPPLRPTGREAGSPPGPPDKDRDAVLQLLAAGPQWPDEICRILSVPVPRLHALLLTLTLESVVVCGPSGRVSLVTV
jgi:DNA processing protein